MIHQEAADDPVDFVRSVMLWPSMSNKHALERVIVIPILPRLAAFATWKPSRMPQHCLVLDRIGHRDAAGKLPHIGLNESTTCTLASALDGLTRRWKWQRL
nr:hypothetical protein CFP56_11370 [Quercus suber]